MNKEKARRHLKSAYESLNFGEVNMFILVEMKMVGLRSNVLKILFQILMSVKREFQGYKDTCINILAVLSARREER